MAISDSAEESLTGHLKKVITDGLDYLGSVLSLLQARLVELALSSFVFVGLLCGAAMFGLAAIVLLTVALGIWLAHLTGSAAWSLLILGVLFGVVAFVAAQVALRWLSKLKS